MTVKRRVSAAIGMIFMIATALLVAAVIHHARTTEELEANGVILSRQYGVCGFDLSSDDVPHNGYLRQVTSYVSFLSYNYQQEVTIPLREVFDSVSAFRYVRHVIIAKSTIDEDIARKLLRFKHLQGLVLRDCSITPDAMKRIAEIQSLYGLEMLSCRGVTSSDLTVLNDASNLKRIRITGDEFDIIPVCALLRDKPGGIHISVNNYAAKFPDPENYSVEQ